MKRNASPRRRRFKMGNMDKTKKWTSKKATKNLVMLFLLFGGEIYLNGPEPPSLLAGSLREAE
jgi:hypothetical protein